MFCRYNQKERRRLEDGIFFYCAFVNHCEFYYIAQRKTGDRVESDGEVDQLLRIACGGWQEGARFNDSKIMKI